MNGGSGAAMVAALAAIALLGAKALRHADEARLAIGPAARAIAADLDEAGAAEVKTALELASEQQEGGRRK